MGFNSVFKGLRLGNGKLSEDWGQSQIPLHTEIHRRVPYKVWNSFAGLSKYQSFDQYFSP